MTGSRMRSLDLTWFLFQPLTNKDSQVTADATTCVPGLRHMATYEMKSPKTVKQEQMQLITNWFWIYSPRDNTTDKHNRSAQQTCFEHLEPNKSRVWRLTWKEGCLYIWKYRACLTVNFQVPPHTELYTVNCKLQTQTTGSWSGSRKNEAGWSSHGSDVFQANGEPCKYNYRCTDAGAALSQPTSIRHEYKTRR